MGIKDTITISYMKTPEVFADAFNYYLYGGKQIIQAKKLKELDTRELAVPYSSRTYSKQPVQRFRDIIKSAAAMGDEENTYLILAIEAQSHTHYAMPVRDMLYDAMQYTKQVENIEIIKSICWNPPA